MAGLWGCERVIQLLAKGEPPSVWGNPGGREILAQEGRTKLAPTASILPPCPSPHGEAHQGQLPQFPHEAGWEAPSAADKVLVVSPARSRPDANGQVSPISGPEPRGQRSGRPSASVLQGERMWPVFWGTNAPQGGRSQGTLPGPVARDSLWQCWQGLRCGRLRGWAGRGSHLGTEGQGPEQGLGGRGPPAYRLLGVPRDTQPCWPPSGVPVGCRQNPGGSPPSLWEGGCISCPWAFHRAIGQTVDCGVDGENNNYDASFLFLRGNQSCFEVKAI